MPRRVFSRDEALARAKEHARQERYARLKAVRKQEDDWARKVRQEVSQRVTSFSERLTDDSKSHFEAERDEDLARLAELADDLQRKLDARNQQFHADVEQGYQKRVESEKMEMKQKKIAQQRGSLALSRQAKAHQQRDAASRQRSLFLRKAEDYGNHVRQHNQQTWLLKEPDTLDDTLLTADQDDPDDSDEQRSQVVWTRNKFGVLCRSKVSLRTPLMQTHPLHTMSHLSTVTEQVILDPPSFDDDTQPTPMEHPPRPCAADGSSDGSMTVTQCSEPEKLYDFDPFAIEYFAAKRRRTSELIRRRQSNQSKVMKLRKKSKKRAVIESNPKMQSIPEDGLLQSQGSEDSKDHAIDVAVPPLMNGFQRAEVESTQAREKAEHFSTAVELRSHQRAVQALRELRREQKASRMAQELQEDRVKHKQEVGQHYTQVMKKDRPTMDAGNQSANEERERSLESEFEMMFGATEMKKEEQRENEHQRGYVDTQSSGVEADIDEEESHRIEIPVPLTSHVDIPSKKKNDSEETFTVPKGWFESLLSELPKSLRTDIVENTKQGVSVDKALLEELVSQLKRVQTESAIGERSTQGSTEATQTTAATTASQSAAQMMGPVMEEEEEHITEDRDPSSADDVPGLDEDSQLLMSDLSDINIDNIERKQAEFKQRIDALMMRERELEQQLGSEDQETEQPLLSVESPTMMMDDEASSVNLSRISSVPSLRESFFEHWKDESLIVDNDSDDWTLSSVQSEDITSLMKKEFRDKVDGQFNSILTDADFDKLTKAVMKSELEELL